MLEALVYESQAGERLTDAELEVVLVGSRVRNARRGITGVLLKHDGRIVQYLEGPPEALDRTFAAIEASVLHDTVRVLARTAIPARVFDGWQMAFTEFQPSHQLMAATDDWRRDLPRLRTIDANPPLARLIDCWDSFEAAVRP